MAVTGQFTIDEMNSFSDSTTYVVSNNSNYLLGILNSKLITFIFSRISSDIQGGYYRWKHQYMGQLPIYTPDFDKLADKTRHDKMVELVTQMLSLHAYLQKAKTDQERRLVQQEIETTDVKIRCAGVRAVRVDYGGD